MRRPGSPPHPSQAPHGLRKRPWRAPGLVFQCDAASTSHMCVVGAHHSTPLARRASSWGPTQPSPAQPSPGCWPSMSKGFQPSSCGSEPRRGETRAHFEGTRDGGRLLERSSSPPEKSAGRVHSERQAADRDDCERDPHTYTRTDAEKRCERKGVIHRYTSSRECARTRWCAAARHQPKEGRRTET